MNVFELFGYYFLATFLVISLVVFVHEMGHFLIARHYQFPVKTFSIGFGREVWGRTDRHGTRWKISLLPLGGYVIIDEQDKPLYQRVFVTLAGPIANFIFFIALIMAGYSFLGQSTMPKTIHGLSLASEAKQAGLKLGDELLSINGLDIPNLDDDLKNMIADIHSATATIVVRRGDKKLAIDVPLTSIKDHDDFGYDFKRKRLGILFGAANLKLSSVNSIAGVSTKDDVKLARAEIIKHFDRDVVVNFGEKDETEDVLIHPRLMLNKDLLQVGSRDDDVLILSDRKLQIFRPLPLSETLRLTGRMISRVVWLNTGEIFQMVTGRKDSKEVGGVVKVGEMTGHAASHAVDSGLWGLINLIAILSAEIGFFNLLPFPVLDGGNLVFQAYEFLRGRPPNEKIKAYLNSIGLLLLLCLVVVANLRNLFDIFLQK